ncbi:MAG: hypothetical protein ABI779_18580 [Acidobacteriota bacterium]
MGVRNDAPRSISLPPTPELSGWGAFNLYYWIDTVGMVVVGAMGLGIVVRLLTKRRGATAWMALLIHGSSQGFRYRLARPLCRILDWP